MVGENQDERVKFHSAPGKSLGKEFKKSTSNRALALLDIVCSQARGVKKN